MITKIVRSLTNSFKGLYEAYRSDKSFRLEVWSTPLFAAFVYIFWPLAPTELLFVILAYSSILITELINTAFERALERLHPEHHELIGQTKDIASAAVLVAIFFAFIVGLIIALSRFSF